MEKLCAAYHEGKRNFEEIDFVVYDLMENMGSIVMTITCATDSDKDSTKYILIVFI